MFKFFRLGAAMLASVLVLASCNKTPDEIDVKPEDKTPVVKTVSVAPATHELKPTETVKLTATVAGDNLSDTSVEWSTSDESFATVAADGTVTAVAPGTATITATAKADKTKKGTATITVLDPSLSTFDALKLLDGEAEVGETLNLDLKDASEEGLVKELVIKIEPETEGVVFDMLPVTQDGDVVVAEIADGKLKITANGDEGEATITVTAKKEGYNDKTVSVKVVVVDTTPAAENQDFDSFKVKDKDGNEISEFTIDLKDAKGFMNTAEIPYGEIFLVSEPFDAGVKYDAKSSGNTITATAKSDTDDAWLELSTVPNVTEAGDEVTVTITASKTGYNAATATLKIKVVNTAEAEGPKKATINNYGPTTLTLAVGDVDDTTLVPVAGEGCYLSCTIENEDIVDVEPEETFGATVTAKQPGNTTITFVAKRAGYEDSDPVVITVTVTGGTEEQPLTSEQKSKDEWTGMQVGYNKVSITTGTTGSASSEQLTDVGYPGNANKMAPVRYIYDDNTNDFWHSKFNQNADVHTVTLIFDSAKEFDAIQLFNSPNSSHKNYGTSVVDIYYDTDQVDANKKLGTINFNIAETSDNKTLVLSKSISATKLFLNITPADVAKKEAQLAELYLYKKN